MLTSYGEEQTKVIALFRQCTMKDLSVLQSFSRKTFFETFADVNTTENMTAYLDKAFAPEKLRMELSDTAAAFYFLYWNGSLAGYLKLNEAAAQTDIHDEQSLEIERIYVCKDFQGAGALQKIPRSPMNKTRLPCVCCLQIWLSCLMSRTSREGRAAVVYDVLYAKTAGTSASYEAEQHIYAAVNPPAAGARAEKR